MIIRVMDRILIAGAGITGAVTSSILRSELPNQCHIAVWDKARGSGGRMTTSRSKAHQNSSVDLGAQYVSADPLDYLNHNRIYKEFEKKGILKPLKGVIEGDKPRPSGTRHFVCPDGMDSLAKYLLHKSDVNMKHDQRILSLNKKENKWLVTSENGCQEEFNAVVLTMPVPQILALEGSVCDTMNSQPTVKDKLQKVQYSSRFALGLFYDPGHDIDVPWCAKYFKGDPVIVFVSIDNKKRDNARAGTSVLVHASVPFSLNHIDEDKETVCTEHILPQLQKLLPELPTHSDMKCHKWRYSQVFQGYEGSPGCVVLCHHPLLVCAGDAFTHSKFDGCIDSAKSATEAVLKRTAPTNL